jgi:hypothetical protein
LQGTLTGIFTSRESFNHSSWSLLLTLREAAGASTIIRGKQQQHLQHPACSSQHRDVCVSWKRWTASGRTRLLRVIDVKKTRSLTVVLLLLVLSYTPRSGDVMRHGQESANPDCAGFPIRHCGGLQCVSKRVERGRQGDRSGGTNKTRRDR